MAKFVELRLPGEEMQTIHVNVDRVRLLRSGTGGRATIFFDEGLGITVVETPGEIVDRLGH